MFIDTHAHIYSEEFKDDLENMLDNAANAGITDIYMPNIDSTSIEEMMRIADRQKNCHAMMGLHPCYVKENYKEELSIVEKYLASYTFAGVGEIGIDLYWDKTFAVEQETVFRRQIALAKEYGIPFVIHSRDSLDITIDIVSELQDGSLSGIFHCFNGTLDQAKRIMETGFYMGIGGVITYKNAGVDKVVADIPMDFLVLETDSPYLSPVPYRGKRNECAYIAVIADKLAEVKEMTKSEIGAVTTFNANKIFRVTP
jgi:TatD DNase family protein